MQLTTYHDLLSYLPEFMRDFAEIQAIAKTEEIELEDIEMQNNVALEAMMMESEYATTHDMHFKLSHFPRCYNRISDDYGTKNHAEFMKMNNLPYVYKNIPKLLEAFLHLKGCYIVELEENYIKFAIPKADYVNEDYYLRKFLDRILPCSMYYDILYFEEISTENSKGIVFLGEEVK